MSNLTPEKIHDALKNILNPKSISGISIDDGNIILSIEVDPSRGKEMEDLRQSVQSTLEKLPGVQSVLVVLTAEKSSPPPIPTKVTGAPRTAGMGGHKISSRPVAPRVRHMIAVASGKGGVGKSTVSSNLAASFLSRGLKVGLLDADIYGASQPRMMGFRQSPETNDDDLIIPPMVHGIKMMSMGFFVDPESPVIWRGPMVHSAIQQLLRDVDWGDLDILVIDLPPGTGDAQLSLAQYVPLAGAVIVSTPQDVALSEAKKGMAMFQKTGVPVLGLIENMSYHICSSCGHREHIFDHGGVKTEAARLGVEFLGEIPLHIDVRLAADSGKPMVLVQPEHAISKAFLSTSDAIVARLSTVKKAVG